MSVPTKNFEQTIAPLETLATAEVLTVQRIMHDNNIVTQLTNRFQPQLIASATEVAGAQGYASINAAFPTAANTEMTLAAHLARNKATVVANQDNLDRTMAGDVMAVALEPDILPTAELRNYTSAERSVVLNALRKAASTPGHRREANYILAQVAPARSERLKSRLVLRLAKMCVNMPFPA